MSDLFAMEAFFREMDKLGGFQTSASVRKLFNEPTVNGLCLGSDLAKTFNQSRNHPVNIQIRSIISEGMLFFEWGYSFGGCIKPEVLKDGYWIGYTVNLNGMTDGQIAWVESVSDFWFIRKQGASYRWFQFSKK
ncbi:hypothetical protein MK805_10195 [Shimazuella sp. AN120528]|uniref:hypothetical protein n=1 Tax=Shimazuella soli TaxID=1892854 RepID=UPI001F0FE2AA|nr:hypothetical protein [Shimazuella soli]MCH5585340.1 hypothetical protein [Shimazuella soli]